MQRMRSLPALNGGAKPQPKRTVDDLSHVSPLYRMRRWIQSQMPTYQPTLGVLQLHVAPHPRRNTRMPPTCPPHLVFALHSLRSSPEAPLVLTDEPAVVLRIGQQVKLGRTLGASTITAIERLEKEHVIFRVSRCLGHPAETAWIAVPRRLASLPPAESAEYINSYFSLPFDPDLPAVNPRDADTLILPPYLHYG